MKFSNKIINISQIIFIVKLYFKYIRVKILIVYNNFISINIFKVNTDS